MDKAKLKGKLETIKVWCHDVMVACNKVSYAADGLHFQDEPFKPLEAIAGARKEIKAMDDELAELSKEWE